MTYGALNLDGTATVGAFRVEGGVPSLADIIRDSSWGEQVRKAVKRWAVGAEHNREIWMLEETGHVLHRDRHDAWLNLD